MKKILILFICLLVNVSSVQAAIEVSLEKIIFKNCYSSYKKQYGSFKNHKVFTYAMDDEGRTSCGWAYGHDDLAQAKKDAITSCKRNTVNSECKFIDIDGEIIIEEGVFPTLITPDEDPLSEDKLKQMMSDAESIIDGNCLPFYKKYLTTMHGHRAFSYARDSDGNYACGMSGSGHSIIQPAKTQALEQCEINIKKRGNKKTSLVCKVYATNYDVVANKDDFPVESDTKDFLAAVLLGDIEKVKTSLANGADVNLTSKKGITPIFVAAMTGNFELYELLLEKGADYRVEHNDGSNLVMAAAGGKNINIVRSILEKDLDVNKQNNEGNTALHIAIMTLQMPIVKVLIEHDADRLKENNKKISPEKIATTLKVDLNNIESETIDISDVNARDEDGWTPLFWAAKDNKLQTIKDLLAKGADINARDNFGSTPLVYAINHEKVSAIKLLLKNGTNVKNKDKTGETPLMNAAYKNNLNIVNLLLENGADKTSKDKSGKVAFNHLGPKATDAIKQVLSLDE